MRCDPDRRHRRSIRLKGYNYAQPGAYFVTVCVHNRQCLFGKVVGAEVALNPVGAMVSRAWAQIPTRLAGWQNDVFVVMPNHLHGILVAWGDHYHEPYTCSTPAGSLGRVVQAFKSITTVEYTRGVKESGWPPFDKRLWQRDHYERIIRDEDELQAIREYIAHNPSVWDADEEDPYR